MTMRVAIYDTSRCQKLLGTLELRNGRIRAVAPPLADATERADRLFHLNVTLRHPRPRGLENDADFLAAMPKMWRGSAVILGDGEQPELGFDDQEELENSPGR